MSCKHGSCEPCDLCAEEDAEQDREMAIQARIDAAVAAERELWAATVRRMHAADDRYGCGFYNNDEWRTAYDELRAMCGPTVGVKRETP